MKRYTISYERDEGGWWLASVKEVAGCRTQGRSIRQARSRIREALSLFVEDVANAEFSDQLRLSREMKAALRKLRDAKKRAVREELRARTTAQDVARLLTQKLNLSVRDAGEILNLSHQRIEQLVHDR